MRRLGIGLGVLLLAASAGAGDDEAAEERGGNAPGYLAYQQYCAACHGVRGDGEGAVAPAMEPPPTDLTRLEERYGKPIPKQKLMRLIDGRDPIAGHGTREMPVWGKRLYQDMPSQMPDVRKRGTILAILRYLETIQQPPA